MYYKQLISYKKVKSSSNLYEIVHIFFSINVFLSSDDYMIYSLKKKGGMN